MPDSHVFTTAIASPSEKSGVAVGVGASAVAQEVVAMANKINAERINFTNNPHHPVKTGSLLYTVR